MKEWLGCDIKKGKRPRSRSGIGQDDGSWSSKVVRSARSGVDGLVLWVWKTGSTTARASAVLCWDSSQQGAKGAPASQRT